MGHLLEDRIGDVREFVDGLRRSSGGTVLDPEAVATLMARRGENPVDRLTTRERDVLERMALPVDTDDNRRVRAVLTWLKM